MKILVQDPNSREYLTQNRDWSALVAEAQEFNDPELAAKFAKRHTFRDFQVVIHFNFMNESVPIFSAGVWTVPQPAPMRKHVPKISRKRDEEGADVTWAG